MSAEPRDTEPQKCRTLPIPNVADHILEESRRLSRFASVAIADMEVLERRQIRRDVAARCLEIARNRDTVSVVLDVEEDRKLERGGDGQRGPEAIRCGRRFAAEDDCYRAIVGPVVENVTMVRNRLRPANRWRVLRSDVSGHRQNDRTILLRKIADDPDVAAVAEAAGFSERSCKCVLESESERQ